MALSGQLVGVSASPGWQMSWLQPAFLQQAPALQTPAQHSEAFEHELPSCLHWPHRPSMHAPLQQVKPS